MMGGVLYKDLSVNKINYIIDITFKYPILS